MRTQALAAEDDDDDEHPTPHPDSDVVFRPCPLCRGRGRMEVVVDRTRPREVIVRPCIVCRGQGFVVGRLTQGGASSNAVLMKDER
jgi:hypothetical protein